MSEGAAARDQAVWDQAAATFDDEPDHGLRDAAVEQAWGALLAAVLPEPPASIADLGCGTGSLSVLLARAGHDDVVLTRHVLWAMPDPPVALANWVQLLRPGGRLVLIEGRWTTGAGLSAADCTALVRRHRREAQVRILDDPVLWGKPVTDERYLVLSRH